MKVKELIEFLQTQDQELEVVYSIHSEQCLLEADDITIYEACQPRPDGWVQNKRPDKLIQKYIRVG